MLTLSNGACEIRDFKTGRPKPEHKTQIRMYAVLWARDTELNPKGRLADRLVLSYNNGDAEVSAPNGDQITAMEGEMMTRTQAALSSISIDPPEARPSEENCKFCFVRHLCEDYWHWQENSHSEQEVNGFADVQVALTSQQGNRSWNCVVESSRSLKEGSPMLLRIKSVQFAPSSGQRVRLLNVHVRQQYEETFEGQPSFVVATMGTNSEAFLLS